MTFICYYLPVELIFLVYNHIVCVFRCMLLEVKAAAPEGDTQYAIHLKCKIYSISFEVVSALCNRL